MKTIVLTALAAASVALPAHAQQYPGFTKIKEDDGAIHFVKLDSIRVRNARSRTIGYEIVIALKNPGPLAYSKTGYEASCASGLVYELYEGTYTTTHGLYRGGWQRKEATPANGSIYAQVRDALCKGFGF